MSEEYKPASKYALELMDFLAFLRDVTKDDNYSRELHLSDSGLKVLNSLLEQMHDTALELYGRLPSE